VAPRKGPHRVEEVDPNTVEILFTNYAPQRLRPVFWSLHYEAFFQAAGFPTLDYTGSRQFQSFEQVALGYDADQWNEDAKTMRPDYPFPYIDTDVIQPPQPLRAGQPAIISRQPPSPAGRGQVYETVSATMVHEPWYLPICPLGTFTPRR
jgi:hypothetical protein